MIRALLFALALMAASAASAGSWVDCASGEPSDGFTGALRSICFHWTATGDSTLIRVPCTPIDFQLTPSTTDTSLGATAYVYRCTQGTPGSAAPAAGCSKMLVDTDGDAMVTAADDVPLDGVAFATIGQQYQTAKLLYVSPQAATSGRTARLMISCH